MAGLFDPLAIRDLTFANRVFVSPMCQYSSRDGYANDWHFVHLGSRAVGGAGLVLDPHCGHDVAGARMCRKPFANFSSISDLKQLVPVLVPHCQQITGVVRAASLRRDIH